MFGGRFRRISADYSRTPVRRAYKLGVSNLEGVIKYEEKVSSWIETRNIIYLSGSIQIPSWIYYTMMKNQIRIP